jgi:hypothetical protein
MLTKLLGLPPGHFPEAKSRCSWMTASRTSSNSFRSCYIASKCEIELVIVGGLEMAVEVAKVLRVDREVGFCDNTLRNALRDVGLRACEKIPKPCLLQENVQEKLCFATIQKD